MQMRQFLATLKPDDLDEASIFLFRIWAFLLLGIDPSALVIKEPEYVVLTDEWLLYCNREAIDQAQLTYLAQDTSKPIICAASQLPEGALGLDVLNGNYEGPTNFLPVVQALIRSANELPPASVGRDPHRGRWMTKTTGEFELWRGKQGRIICSESGGSMS
jgi:hypothetical protein